MKIALVSHVARPSGAEIVLERLAAELSPEHEVHVLFFEDGPMVARLRGAGARVRVLPVGGGLVDARRGTARLPGRDVLRAVRVVRSALRTLGPDIVHSHSLKSALVAGTAARSLGVPFVWHLHDRITTEYLPRPTVALVRAALMVLPDAVAVNSESTRQTIRSRAPIAIVPNPVPRPPEGFVARDGRDGPPLAFGLVGRITPWKGQDLFLEAFAKAFPVGPQRAILVGDAMFGEDAFGVSVDALITRLGLGGRVERRGFRDDVWNELARLDVLVHASRIPEPFGLVLVEGISAGLTVIAADSGGPAEFLAGVDGAALVTPGDVDALAAALRSVTVRDGVGTAGSDEILERFSPGRAVSATLKLYARATDRQEDMDS